MMNAVALLMRYKMFFIKVNIKSHFICKYIIVLHFMV